MENNDLKIYDDGTFDIEFIEIIKNNDKITVKVETPFGIHKMSYDKKADYIHTTGMKKYEYETIKKLKDMYGKNYKNTSIVEEKINPTHKKLISNDI